MTLKDLARQHKELSLKIEALEAERKLLGQTILQAMTDKSMCFGAYTIRRFSRVSITSTIDQAREFQAIKMEEVVDKDKLKLLYRSGTTVPGVKEIQYISVTKNEL